MSFWCSLMTRGMRWRPISTLAVGMTAFSLASCHRPALVWHPDTRQSHVDVRIAGKGERAVVDSGQRGFVVVHESAPLSAQSQVAVRSVDGATIDLGVVTLQRRSGPDTRAAIGASAMRQAGAWVFDWQEGAVACATTESEVSLHLARLSAKSPGRSWVWVQLVTSPFEIEETSPPFVAAEDAKAWLRARGLTESVNERRSVNGVPSCSTPRPSRTQTCPLSLPRLTVFAALLCSIRAQQLAWSTNAKADSLSRRWLKMERSFLAPIGGSRAVTHRTKAKSVLVM